jgi:hypothetical protein
MMKDMSEGTDFVVRMDDIAEACRELEASATSTIAIQYTESTQTVLIRGNIFSSNH